MEWTEISAAVLAGGIVGQLATLFIGNLLTKNRDFNKWKIIEQHKLYSELLKVLTHIPKDDVLLKNWTYEIRDISLRIHILFKGGIAPAELNNSMERLFQLARDKKTNRETADWTNLMRLEIRVLREEMSNSLR